MQYGTTLSPDEVRNLLGGVMSAAPAEQWRPLVGIVLDGFSAADARLRYLATVARGFLEVEVEDLARAPRPPRAHLVDRDAGGRARGPSS